MRVYQCLLAALFSLNVLPLVAQSSVTRSPAVTWEISYTGDLVSNVSGGIRSGTGYLGLAGIRSELNTEGAKLWKGGLFSLHLIHTHGSTPSTEMIGDLQVVSNIEAGNHTCFQEMYYKQTLGFLEITAGLQDLNASFAITDMATVFVNSSFGIIPTFSGNLPAPVFPLTAPGLTLKIGLGQHTDWRLAVFDGCPTAFEHNHLNLSWKLNREDGALLVSEWQFTGAETNSGTSVRLGMYSRRHQAEKDPETPSATMKTCYGAYALAEGTIWQSARSGRRAGVFLQAGLSPDPSNVVDFYAGLGTVLSGLVRMDGEDRLGLAVAHASLTAGAGHETTLECTYHVPITKHLSLQPDFQIVMRPGGQKGSAWVGLLRLGIVI